MINFYRLLALFSFAAALLFAPGCASTWDELYAGPAYITVNDSPLNWIEIFYLPEPGGVTTRISMRDKGEVRVERGRSKLVNSPFAYEYEDESWDNHQVDTFWIPHKNMTEVFQSLVNYGLLKVVKKPDELPPKAVLIKGNLNVRKIDRYAFDDDLIQQIETLVRLYSRNLPPLKETKQP